MQGMNVRRALVLVAGLVLVAAVGVQAAPTISIASPVAGTSFSKAFWETIPVSGTVAFDAPVASTRKFNLRREACGGSVPANTRLSTTLGSDTGPCGNLLTVATPGTTNYPAENGVPLQLDPSRDGKATIVTSSNTGLGEGVGNQTVTATLTGVPVGGAKVTIASGSAAQMIMPGTNAVTTVVNLPIADDLAGVTFESISLALGVQGSTTNGFVNYGGASFIDLPIMDIGTVEVSSDSSTFTASRTVTAVVNPDGTWTAEAVMPAGTGAKTIYARAVQAGTKVLATPVQVNVTS